MKTIVALAIVFLLGFAPYSLAAIGSASPSNCAPIAAAANLSMRPGSGVEWLIHNIWFPVNVTLVRTDGTDTATLMSLLGPDYQPIQARVTNGNWLELKNDDASSAVLCFDAIITAE